MSSALEAKLVVLGAQGVGKTSLLHRYIHNTFSPNTPSQSTLGASFLTKRLQEHSSDTEVRLQIWDTAGQERFRSISRLYYRGAHVAILCYDITDERSWEEMKGWLSELREQCGGIGSTSSGNGEGIIVHVVGTKSDIVAVDPSKRKVPFERTIAFVADQLGPSQASTPPTTAPHHHHSHSHSHHQASAHSHAQSLFGALTPSAFPSVTTSAPPQQPPLQSPDSKRSSGFWGSDIAWDSCHEVSSRDGEGIEEVFRVIARKLVEQKNKRLERELASNIVTPGVQGAGMTEAGGYFEGAAIGGRGDVGGGGSFRVGHGDKRRSWLGLPATGYLGSGSEDSVGVERGAGRAGGGNRRGKCC
ncbi:MAG: hypothetical protein Q9160_005381 [Pyrenula sp. 1 TL-2023]